MAVNWYSPLAILFQSMSAPTRRSCRRQRQNVGAAHRKTGEPISEPAAHRNAKMGNFTLALLGGFQSALTAYNLANFLRTIATLEAIASWSLTSLLGRLIKTGIRLVKHARYAVFQMAEAFKMGNAG